MVGMYQASISTTPHWPKSQIILRSGSRCGVEITIMLRHRAISA